MIPEKPLAVKQKTTQHEGNLLCARELAAPGIQLCKVLHTEIAGRVRRERPKNEESRIWKLVGPNGLEPSTSSVSRKRSNQTELRAYVFFIVIGAFSTSKYLDEAQESRRFSPSELQSMPCVETIV